MIDKAKPNEYNEILSKANKYFSNENLKLDFTLQYPKLYNKENFSAREHYVMRDNGEITAIVGSFENTMNVYGSKLKLFGIGTVCVDPDHRKKGYMQSLIKAAIADMKSSKADFAFLGGRRQRYEYFGFTPCGMCADYLFNRDNIKHFYGDTSFSYSFISVSRRDTQYLEKIYELYNRRHCRLERDYGKLYDIMTCRGVAPVAIIKNGSFYGYIIVNDTFTQCVEFEAYDIAELGHITNDYIRFYGVPHLEFSGVFPFETKKNEFFSKHSERVLIRNCESLLVFNYIKMLKTFFDVKAKYFRLADGEMTVEVTDAQKFKITVKDNIAEVEEYKGIPDILMTQVDASGMFFGAWKALASRGADFPPFAHNWFPLPYFFTRPDFV